MLTKTALVRKEDDEKHERYSTTELKPFAVSDDKYENDKKSCEFIVLDYLNLFIQLCREIRPRSRISTYD